MGRCERDAPWKDLVIMRIVIIEELVQDCKTRRERPRLLEEIIDHHVLFFMLRDEECNGVVTHHTRHPTRTTTAAMKHGPELVGHACHMLPLCTWELS